MVDLARLEVTVSSSGLQKTARGLDDLGKKADAAERRTATLGRSSQTATTSMRSFGLALGAAAGAAAGLGLAARRVVEYSDRMASMRGQLALVTDSQQDLNDVYSRSLRLSNATGQSLETTVNLYARLTRSTESLSLTETQRLKITDAVNKSMVVSGATTEEADRAIVQWTQSLSGGVLRAEEYNSIIEQAPYLLDAMASGMGVTRGELRGMMLDGEVTAERMTDAMLKISDSITQDFEQMPVTAGRAMTSLRNDILDTFGAISAQPMIDAVDSLRDTLADPELKTATQEIAGFTVQFAAPSVKAAAEWAKLAASFGELPSNAARLLGYEGGEKTLSDVVARFENLSHQIAFYEQNGAGAHRSTQKLREELDGLKTQLAVTDQAIVMVNGRARIMDDAFEGAAEMLDTYTGAYRDGLLPQKTFNMLQHAGVEQTETLSGVLRSSANIRIKDATATATQNKKLEDYLTGLRFQVGILGESSREQHLLTQIREHGAEGDAEATAAIRQLEGALWDANHATKESASGVREHIENLEYEISIIGKSEREQFILNTTREKGARATEEQREQISRLAGALYDQQEATQAATKTQEAFDKALEGMAERIDTEFSSAWRDALQGNLKDFDDFTGSIKDAFLNMLAEMAHLAITRPIVVGITGAMGLGASTSALAGGGSASGLGSLVSAGQSAYSTLTGGIAGSYSGLYSNIAYATGGGWGGAGGFISDAAAAQAAKIGGMSNLGALGYGALNIGAGMVGNYAGQQVFGGNTTGIGSTAGGMVGSIWGPVGTALGSFIGEGLETGLGNLLGFGGKSHNRVYADISGGQIGASYYTDKGHHGPQQEAVEGITPVLQALLTSIGGSSYNDKISVSAKHGFEVGVGTDDYFRTKDAETFVEEMFRRFIDGAGHLDSQLRDLILAFDGTIEQTSLFATGISSIHENAQLNSVTQAIEDFTAAAPTLTSAYIDQGGHLHTLISNYDGSASATTELAQRLTEHKASAYQFAMAIQQVGQSLDHSATRQAASIRESIMSTEELMRVRKDERDGLRASLRTLTDPQEIERASQRILELNQKLFSSLSEEGQRNQAEAYATYAERTSEIASETLSRMLGGIQQDQDDINQRIVGLLETAGDRMNRASEVNEYAAELFARWAQNLQTHGIEIRVDTRSPEVNA